jgi:hypothetical protein
MTLNDLVVLLKDMRTPLHITREMALLNRIDAAISELEARLAQPLPPPPVAQSQTLKARATQPQAQDSAE